ncbi:hypothetical protein CDD83_2960 [Cordyceps sp. RAO-2017]|nr:hypothetical protein CDD83_2960 [Cordyceps sp. RAO-2017]
MKYAPILAAAAGMCAARSLNTTCGKTEKPKPFFINGAEKGSCRHFFDKVQREACFGTEFWCSDKDNLQLEEDEIESEECLAARYCKEDGIDVPALGPCHHNIVKTREFDLFKFCTPFWAGTRPEEMPMNQTEQQLLPDCKNSTVIYNLCMTWKPFKPLKVPAAAEHEEGKMMPLNQTEQQLLPDCKNPTVPYNLCMTWQPIKPLKVPAAAEHEEGSAGQDSDGSVAAGGDWTAGK